MSRKLFLLSIIIFSAAATISAQVQVHLGVTTAYNATFILDEGLSEAPRYNSKITYNWSPVGFNAGIDFTRKFGLSLESILSKQGQVFEIVDIADNVVGQRSIDLEYINLPLLVRFMNEGNSGVRGNFNVGPQLSILTNASDIIQYSASTQTFAAGAKLPAGSTEVVHHPDGTTTARVPSQSAKELMSKKADSFKNAEFQIAAAFGLDIDITRNMFISVQARGNYSLTDMRNGDVIEDLKQGNSGDVFGKRANLVVGVQVGLHFLFGTTRSFKYKGH